MSRIIRLNQISKIRKPDLQDLATHIKEWAKELGFQQAGISDIDLHQAEKRLAQWLARQFHGEMHYMQQHGSKRSRPAELVPGTVRVISVRMDYLPGEQAATAELLDHPSKAYISRYALGRDYHKVLRARLKALARKITDDTGAHGYRVLVDSAPVLEKPLAEKAGLGKAAGGKSRSRLDRQTHEFAQQRRRFVVFPRRVIHRPSTAGGQTGKIALRQLPGLS